MTRGCDLCGHPHAKKRDCCGMKLCDIHADSCAAHSCPTQARLTSMSPADVKRWKAENAPEQELTTQVIAALNALGGVHVTRLDSGSPRQRGNRLSEPGAPDVIGYSYPDGRFIGVETKGSHGPSCNREACGCRLQREWGERLIAAGGVYVGNVRRLQDAIDGVRMGLARARARDSERSTG